MLSTLLLCGLASLQSDGVEKLSSALAQLHHAKQVHALSRGTKGAARIEALQNAVEAYDGVRQHWPQSGAPMAEACFRRGELHRTLGQPGRARSAFLESIDTGAGTNFPPRALLEIGHLHRRASEFDQALEHYGQVLKRKGTQLRSLNDAREWIGKVQLELERWPESVAAFAAWGAHAEAPIEVVRAVDLEARAWVGQGKLDQAESRLAEVRQSMESLVSEPTKEAAALKRALERMQAPGLIRAAREKAAAAASTEEEAG